MHECKIKIPFCKRPFHPKCNCAYLHISNEKNMTLLPDNIVTEMDGLRQLNVINCSLSKLPSNMENLVEMTSVDLSLNNLTTFHVNIKNWKNLVKLLLMYNRISSYNEEALWNHQSLVSISLADNIGLTIPGNSKIGLPALSFLNIANNGVIVDTILNQKGEDVATM